MIIVYVMPDSARKVSGPRPVLLVLADWYLPGYKGGGPLRVLGDLVEALGDEFEFRVATRDRDLGDDRPYPGVAAGRWTRVGRAQVLYLPAPGPTPVRWKRLLQEVRPDLLYLNSFFSRPYSVLPLLARRLLPAPRPPVLVAPRGELQPEALKLKAARKRAGLAFSAMSGLHADAAWQASSPAEEEAIRSAMRPRGRVYLTPEVRTFGETGPDSVPPKRPGALKAVFLGRIAPIKNLLGALEVLAGLKAEIEYTIHGPIEDRAYWSRCERAIAALPANVRATYAGPLEPRDVIPALRRHHLLYCPSESENFGHAILESLVAGRPVLTGDRTPWKDLEAQGAGWALPLSDRPRFAAVLERLAGAGEAEFRATVARVGSFSARWLEENDARRTCAPMFRELVSGRRKP